MELSSPEKQDLLRAGGKETSGGGSDTNGPSRFETYNYLIGEAEQGSHNNHHRLSMLTRKERNRVRLNQGFTDIFALNQEPKSSQRISLDFDAVLPPRKIPETKKAIKLHSSTIGKRAKRKRKKKKRRKGFKYEEENKGIKTIASAGPYKCYPCPKVNNRRKKFCFSDFVSKVYINQRKNVANETRYDMTVIFSYRNRVKLKAREYLWVASHCRCPKLRAKRMYVLMGTMESHKHKQTRLVISPTDFVRSYSMGQDQRLRHLAKKLKCMDKLDKMF